MEDAEDLFGDIVMCEQRYHGEGYEEGFNEGHRVGKSEGKQFGTIYGAQAGSEALWHVIGGWHAILPVTMVKDSPLVLEWKRAMNDGGVGLGSGFPLGCYLGFASTWKHLLTPSSDEKQSKKIKTLDSLIKLIQSFPCEDPTSDKLQEDMARIRGKVKQVCSMLNIQPDFKRNYEASLLTF